MKTITDKLIVLADQLDAMGLSEDASKLDKIIAVAAAGDPDGGEFNKLLNLFDEEIKLDSDEEEDIKLKDLPEEDDLPGLVRDDKPVHRWTETETAPGRLGDIKRRHELAKLKKSLENEEYGYDSPEYAEHMREEAKIVDQMTAERHLKEKEMLDKGFVKCLTCEDFVKPGQSHYPGNDPEEGPAHSPEAEPNSENPAHVWPTEEVFEDEPAEDLFLPGGELPGQYKHPNTEDVKVLYEPKEDDADDQDNDSALQTVMNAVKEHPELLEKFLLMLV